MYKENLSDLSPSLVKGLTLKEKEQLAIDIRTFLIESISKTGGHLSSNLGTVELIIAMHSVFTTPMDKFVFDVGHQAYTHKLITGRLEGFSRLRSFGGISGFPRPSESEHDAFVAGHSGISVSAALGIASAMDLKNEVGSVIAVTGDGALTNGEIYEGFNNISENNKNLIIIINDNGMSISKNKGAVAQYLSQIRSTKAYHDTKVAVKDILKKVPMGDDISESVSITKKSFKRAILHDNIFENFGLQYYGLVDGHSIADLIDVLELAKLTDKPCVVHITTKKGKGYIPAEENAGQHHAVTKNKDIKEKSALTNTTKEPVFEQYSEVFGRTIQQLGYEDSRICLISAAMKYATGSNYFSKSFPARFFDVGIAEGHAATFAAGLAIEGLIPVFAVYSTFLQRTFDQLMHDIAIEKLHVVLAIDRAGLTGEDGETHQGTFDLPMLLDVPGMTIYSPFSERELYACLKKATLTDKGPVAVRYPRGYVYSKGEEVTDYNYFKVNAEKSNKLFITYGRMTGAVYNSVGEKADILQLIQLSPSPEKAMDIIKSYESICFVEESNVNGSLASKTAAYLLQSGWKGEYKIKAIDGFVTFADVETQMELCGLDTKSLAEEI